MGEVNARNRQNQGLKVGKRTLIGFLLGTFILLKVFLASHTEKIHSLICSHCFIPKGVGFLNIIS